MSAARETTYVLNGEPVDIKAYVRELNDKMPPLTGTQRAIIRALFNVGGEQPGDKP